MRKNYLLGVLSTVSACAIAISLLLVGQTHKIANTKATESYSIRFDKDHNYNLSFDSYNNYYRFDAYSERGTKLNFYSLRNTKNPDDGNWRNYTVASELLNHDPIKGMTDIKVKYEITNEDDYAVKIKYGWVFGYNPYGYYDESELDQYESPLDSNEVFSFGEVQPSYFHMYLKNVNVESIVINFSCVEVLPEVEDGEHFALVSSMDDVNYEDEYTVANTRLDSGFVMSNEQYNTLDPSKDKVRKATAAHPNNEKIAYSDNIMRFKINHDENGYYFTTVNYQGDNGYFYSTNNKDNNDFYIKTEQKTYYDISFNESDNLVLSHTFPYNSSTSTKSLQCYSGAQDQKFYFRSKLIGSDNTGVYLYKYVPVVTETRTLNYSNLSGMSKSYANGNYGKITTAGLSFEYYRTVRAANSSADYTFKMVNPDFYYSDGGYASSFYNISSSPIYGIKKITINYLSSAGIKVSTAKDYGVETTQTLPSHSSYDEEVINVDNANFFKVMTYNSDAYIKDIVLEYTNKTVSCSSSITYSGNRKTYEPYSGSYTPGVTTKTMYISSSETKTYTYYTYNYIKSHQSLKDEAALIDPVDICNYYEAFGCAPANFGQTNFSGGSLKDGVVLPSKSEVSSLFGNKARCISKYSRTDGYATHVPYNNASGQTTPIYYELDIDTDGSYSVNSRQVGRVVAWDYGFSCYNLASERVPVCVYTDDHYATFQEYNNMGGFSPRFDSERNITGRIHTPLTNA